MTIEGHRGKHTSTYSEQLRFEGSEEVVCSGKNSDITKHFRNGEREAKTGPEKICWGLMESQ
jgi:hypothetical protein